MAIAQKLFSEVGYEKTMITDITAQAAIAKATFFHYFPTKEAVLEAIFMQCAQQIEQAIDADTSSTTAVEKLEFFLKQFFLFDQLDPMVTKLEANNQQMLLIGFWQMMQKHLDKTLTSILQQGRAEKTMHIEHLEETILYFWLLISVVLVSAHKKEAAEIFAHKRDIGFTLLEKLLGLPPYSFKLA